MSTGRELDFKMVLKIPRLVYAYLDYLLLLIVDVIVFHEFLSPSYILNGDFTLPPSNLGRPSISFDSFLAGLASVSYNPAAFTLPNFSGPLTILAFSFLRLFLGAYTSHLLIFSLYVLLNSWGTVYLVRTFTRSRVVTTSAALFETYNPATFNILTTIPGAFFVSLIPWLIAFYYKYRIERKGFLYMLLSLITIGFIPAYGPSLLVIASTILAVETYFVLLNRRILSSVLHVIWVFASLAVFHVNLLLTLHRSQEVLSNSVFPGNQLAFAFPQILTYQVTMRWENVFRGYVSAVYGAQSYLVYTSVLLASEALLLGLLALRKNLFPLILGLFFYVPLLGYQSNYLFVYSLLPKINPIFVGIDPYEYDPIIAMWIALSLGSLFGTKVSNPGLSRKALRLAGVGLLLVFTISAAFVAYATYKVNAARFQPIDVPSPYLSAYNDVRNSVFMTVPTSYSMAFDFYWKPGKPIGVMMYWAFPPGLILNQNPVNVGVTSPILVKLYNAYTKGNSTGFQEIANTIGLQYIIWFSPQSIPGGFWPNHPYSWYVGNITKLIKATGFEVYKNYTKIVVLKNPREPAYNITIHGYGFLVSVRNASVDSIVIPLVYGTGWIAYPKSVNVSDYGGLVKLSNVSGVKQIFLVSKISLYNLYDVTLSGLYVGVLAVFYAIYKLRRRSKSE
jgi:hypothetical protein